MNNGLRAMGYEPFPVFRRPPETDPALPYVMTSAHPRQFYNTEFHQLPTTSRGQTTARVTVHPDTAEREGLTEGEEVDLFTRTGARGVRMTVKISDSVAPNVVMADAGWWYPGESSVDESLRSSVNLLTDNDRSDVHMGSATMRGVAVGIRRLGPGRG
jgi:anaerobic selenocysteine-containing dehydrogenase